MKEKSIKEIGTEISVLQSKLGLLRSELYRAGDLHSADRNIREELENIERKIDELQRMYGRQLEGGSR